MQSALDEIRLYQEICDCWPPLAPVWKLPDYLGSDESLDRLLTGFRLGTWPLSDWTHAAHVAVSACLARGVDQPAAYAAMRNGILNFAERAGIVQTPDRGYHETLTRLWTGLIWTYLAGLPAGLTRVDAVRSAVAAFGATPSLFAPAYSFDLLKDRQARREWAPPDQPWTPPSIGAPRRPLDTIVDAAVEDEEIPEEEERERSTKPKQAGAIVPAT